MVTTTRFAGAQAVSFGRGINFTLGLPFILTFGSIHGHGRLDLAPLTALARTADPGFFFAGPRP